MPFVVAEPCIDVLDKACVQQCPVDCIYEGERMAYIHPDECVDCGACEPVCPQNAIFYDEEVPDEFTPFMDANREFFDDLGQPGGAKNVGPQKHDAPLVLQIINARATSV